MSGIVVVNKPDDCPAGTHAELRSDGAGFDCVPNAHLRPFALIWQGDCEGWLVVRLSYAPAINPTAPQRSLGARTAPPLAKRGKRVAGTEIGLEEMAKRVRHADLKAAIRKLQKKIKAEAGAAAPRSYTRTAAKAKPKARSTRKKK